MKNHPHYEIIYNHIVYQIYTGQLCVGDKLESVQDMIKRYNVSLNTIMIVIRLLDKKGFIKTAQGKRSVVISVSGDKNQAFKDLCNKSDLIINVYKTFYTLFPAISEYSTQFFKDDDIKELAEILKIMETNITDIFIFQKQKGLFILKIASMCNNYVIKKIVLSAEESVMLPNMVKNVMFDIETYLEKSQYAYLLKAKNMLHYIKLKDSKNVKNECSELYKWVVDVFINMINYILKKYNVKKEDYIYDKSYLYDIIISDVIDQIFLGVYNNNDYLPSLANMCEKYKVSFPTVLKAYKILNELKIAQTKNGKGTKITIFYASTYKYNVTQDELKKINKLKQVLCFFSLTIHDIITNTLSCLKNDEIIKLIEKSEYVSNDIKNINKLSLYALFNNIIKYSKSIMLFQISINIKRLLSITLYWENFNSDEWHEHTKKLDTFVIEAIDILKCNKKDLAIKLISTLFEEFIYLTSKTINQILNELNT